MTHSEPVSRRAALRKIAAGFATALSVPSVISSTPQSLPSSPKGTMMIVGGGMIAHSYASLLDHGDTLTPAEADPSGILHKLIEEWKEAYPEATRKPVVECISCASRQYMHEDGHQHAILLKKVGAGEVHSVKVGNDLTKAQASNRELLKKRIRLIQQEFDKPETLERLRKADIVFISGGDQEHLSDILQGSEAVDILRNRYQHDPHFVIGGSSAGAMIMSELMIADTAKEPHQPPPMRSGFGFSRMIIETHMAERNRESRLLAAVNHIPGSIGLGLDPSTALVIRNGSAHVHGKGRVLLAHDNTCGIGTHPCHTPLPIRSFRFCEGFDESKLSLHAFRHGDSFAMGGMECISHASQVKRRPPVIAMR